MSHTESRTVPPVGFNPPLYEQIRQYLQFRIDNGEYVHGRDWHTYQLTERDEAARLRDEAAK